MSQTSLRMSWSRTVQRKHDRQTTFAQWQVGGINASEIDLRTHFQWCSVSASVGRSINPSYAVGRNSCWNATIYDIIAKVFATFRLRPSGRMALFFGKRACLSCHCFGIVLHLKQCHSAHTKHCISVERNGKAVAQQVEIHASRIVGEKRGQVHIKSRAFDFDNRSATLDFNLPSSDGLGGGRGIPVRVAWQWLRSSGSSRKAGFG